MKKVYWFGGSPCAGKSSVADRLAERYGLAVYRCDDAWWEHAQRSNAVEHPTLHAIAHMSWDEIWMRPVDVQVAAEFAAYAEEFGMILHDLRSLPPDRPILAEGCALLPGLVAPLLAAPQDAIWFVPAPDFQRRHYAQRAFIREILDQCREPQTAWHNWMDRDEQFGRQVLAGAAARSLRTEVVAGHRPVEELAKLVAAHYRLDRTA